MIYKSHKYNIDFSKVLGFWMVGGSYIDGSFISDLGHESILYQNVKILLGNAITPPHELIITIGKIRYVYGPTALLLNETKIEYNVDSEDYKLYQALKEYWDNK